MSIVVDTNILISALIKDSVTRNLILNIKEILLLPELDLEEIDNHKEEILDKSGLSENEFEVMLSFLLKNFKIIKTEEVINYREEAIEIIGNIDKDDVVFFATALAFNCPIWSDDKRLKEQKKIKVFNTSEVIDYFMHENI